MDKWNDWYKDLDPNTPSSFKYSDTITYEKGFDWLKSCKEIEDWGCGAGGFKRFFTENVKNKYIGVDGSITPFSNVKADLTVYRSNVEGIYMRHILEHNYEWRKILENALNSFTEKFCLVLFTPFVDKTKEIAHNAPHGVDVPDMAFSKDDICSIIQNNNCVYKLESFQTNTGYSIEHIFYITRKNYLAYYSGFCGSNTNESYSIPSIPSNIYDCYFYTNNIDLYEKLKETKWIRKFLYIEPTEDWNESNFQCKHLKACPHMYKDLTNYSNTIWLDSKLGKLNEDLIQQIMDNKMLENDMLLRQHPWTSPFIWYEVDASLKQERYKPFSNKIHNYIYKQINNGLKENTSFHASCGFIIRKMNENTKRIGETWYEHIKECGIQDQISFFFVKQLFSGISVFNNDIIKIKNKYDW
jgi:hypothetical protein